MVCCLQLFHQDTSAAIVPKHRCGPVSPAAGFGVSLENRRDRRGETRILRFDGTTWANSNESGGFAFLDA